MRDEVIAEIVGHIIVRVELTDNRDAIRLTLRNGKQIIGVTEADCCSNTWIEDVIAPDALIGTPVLTVTDLELPEHMRQATKTGNYEDEMAYYGLAITTMSGTCTIAYRNSSNGYYGGWLNWGGSIPYGSKWQTLADWDVYYYKADIN